MSGRKNPLGNFGRVSPGIRPSDLGPQVKDIHLVNDLISGPITLTYHPNVKINPEAPAKNFFIFGDKHFTKQGACPQCHQLPNCLTIGQFLNRVFSNTQVYIDFFLESPFLPTETAERELQARLTPQIRLPQDPDVKGQPGEPGVPRASIGQPVVFQHDRYRQPNDFLTDLRTFFADKGCLAIDKKECYWHPKVRVHYMDVRHPIFTEEEEEQMEIKKRHDPIILAKVIFENLKKQLRQKIASAPTEDKIASIAQEYFQTLPIFMTEMLKYYSTGSRPELPTDKFGSIDKWRSQDNIQKNRIYRQLNFHKPEVQKKIINFLLTIAQEDQETSLEKFTKQFSPKYPEHLPAIFDKTYFHDTAVLLYDLYHLSRMFKYGLVERRAGSGSVGTTVAAFPPVRTPDAQDVYIYAGDKHSQIYRRFIIDVLGYQDYLSAKAIPAPDLIPGMVSTTSQCLNFSSLWT